MHDPTGAADDYRFLVAVIVTWQRMQYSSTSYFFYIIKKKRENGVDSFAEERRKETKGKVSFFLVAGNERW